MMLVYLQPLVSFVLVEKLIDLFAEINLYFFKVMFCLLDIAGKLISISGNTTIKFSFRFLLDVS